jgi:transposase
MYSLIASCKLADVEPQEYLTDVLSRINDHSQLTLHELLPQNWTPLQKNQEICKAD